jgi:DNA (cytosine-5)-methyltransferase 1
MTKPRLLDLFCGAGGCSVGYARAGFEVVGVDINPQPHYPFEFHQADALTYPLEGFDAYHASPPCQRYCQGAKQMGTTQNFPDLIAPMRNVLIKTGKPYIIENIYQAKDMMIEPVMLCGTMFDLGVFRHRLFESNFMILGPLHSKHIGRIGDGKYNIVTGHPGGSSKRDGYKNGNTKDWQIAMGMDWAKGHELVEAIPPAYTEYIGKFLMQAVLAGV